MFKRILTAVISRTPKILLRGDLLTIRQNLDIQKKTAARSRLKNALEEWKSSLPHDAIAPSKTATEMVGVDPSLLAVEDLERLGMMYLKGDGVVQDAKKAYETWTTAAARGSPGAAFSVSGCLLSGMGVKKDEKRAFDIVKDLAENRNYPLGHVRQKIVIIYGHRYHYI